MDQLVFGALQGKYNIEFAEGNVKAIRLKSSETLGINTKPEQILSEYNAIFKGAKSIRLQSAKDSTHEYTWEDEKGAQHSMKVQYQEMGSSTEPTIQNIEF